MISNETLNTAYQVIDDIVNDSRLTRFNALVLLSLKNKGNAKNRYTQLSQDKFNDLCKYAISKKINFGMDSCSSGKFFNYLNSDDTLTEEFKNQMLLCVEPCESSLFSTYINVAGNYSPCSFCEKINDDWNDGISVLNCNDFLKDVWYDEKTENFRKRLISCDRNCPIYNI